MKRTILILSILLGMTAVQAATVGLETARSLAQKFVKANFDFASQNDELTMVYSQTSFYVFNVGENGFVILSANDAYRPIIGYSDESAFDPDNMAPALSDFLDRVNAYRTNRSKHNATMETMADWARLHECGQLVSRYGGRDAEYLVQTKWNQNYPYNYCCPSDPDGPGGHVYAGCVATAAAQVMRYWNHPIQGQGSHTYTPTDNPQYGPITVNYGEAIYDWENMPYTISSASPVEQLEAVGQLIYHVGVSVDMNYRPTSSGAVTGLLCTSLPSYFHYTDQMQHYYREEYSREEYMGFIVSMVDMNWPMVQRGNGHAYVLDGYDDFGMVHLNWGWSGSNDGWFDIDGHNYAEGESVICYCVPAEVYDATPEAPENLVATASDDNGLWATVSWTNPTFTLSGLPLTTIDQIVVKRDKEVVYVEDNVTPGAAMSFVDNLPRFDVYEYSVCAVVNGQPGKSVVEKGISVGPTCQWKFVVSSTHMQGWKGGYVALYNACHNEVNRITITNSSPTSLNVDVPLGLVSMEWVPSESTATNYNITMNIKDVDGNSVYSYSGTQSNMTEGILYEGNNGCGASLDCGVPSNLSAMQDPDDEHAIVLTWEGVENPGYGYLIYRDDQIIRLIADGTTSYRDEDVSIGGHCYQVSVLCEGGMSGETSNMACGTSGACHAPRNLNFEMTSTFKCKLVWERPSPDDGLSGYSVYRKSDTEDYKRIKLLGKNATSYTDNSVSLEGDYYYKLVAHYNDLDCESYPAPYVYDPNQYYLHFYYSPTGVPEYSGQVSIYPNPTMGSLTVEAPGMQRIAVYNMIGQTVQEMSVNADAVSLHLKGLPSGMYLVSVQTMEGTIVKRLSIIE